MKGLPIRVPASAVPANGATKHAAASTSTIVLRRRDTTSAAAAPSNIARTPGSGTGTPPGGGVADDSLADFAWDCFMAWLAAGAPSKTGWPLSTLGVFGNDATARRLTPYIRAWPGEAAHARAVAALDVLAAIGSDVALMLLNGPEPYEHAVRCINIEIDRLKLIMAQRKGRARKKREKLEQQAHQNVSVKASIDIAEGEHESMN